MKIKKVNLAGMQPKPRGFPKPDLKAPLPIKSSKPFTGRKKK